MEINRVERTYRRLRGEGRRVLKLFSGNPNEHGFRFPSEVLEKAYRGYFNAQEYHPHPKGLLAAREAIAGYYRRHGAAVNPENIILTSGTSESFFYLFSLLAQPGDNVLTPNPAYPLFDEIARLARIELRPYHLREDRDWAVDLDDLKEKTDARTRAVVLISPNNPTGAVMTAQEIREISAWANERDIPLICDEVFSEFYFGRGPFPRPMTVTQPQLCFTVNGISKMFALPALKLGWIAVTGEKGRVAGAVDHLETTADTFLSCHTPIQEALPAIFSEGQAFLEGYKEEVRRRKELAVQALRMVPDTRFVEPAGGFYLMVEVTESARHFLHTEEDFIIRLMEEKGIFVHPGYFYDYEKGIHFVISFLTEPKTLEAGLGALVDLLHFP